MNKRTTADIWDSLSTRSRTIWIRAARLPVRPLVNKDWGQIHPGDAVELSQVLGTFIALGLMAEQPKRAVAPGVVA